MEVRRPSTLTPQCICTLALQPRLLQNTARHQGRKEMVRFPATSLDQDWILPKICFKAEAFDPTWSQADYSGGKERGCQQCFCWRLEPWHVHGAGSLTPFTACVTVPPARWRGYEQAITKARVVNILPKGSSAAQEGRARAAPAILGAKPCFWLSCTSQHGQNKLCQIRVLSTKIIPLTSRLFPGDFREGTARHKHLAQQLTWWTDTHFP